MKSQNGLQSALAAMAISTDWVVVLTLAHPKAANPPSCVPVTTRVQPV